MRPAATSLFLTAEAVCWELPLGCLRGTPLLTGLAGMLPVTPSPFPSLTHLEFVCPHLLFQEAVD